jgi:hypothetical protein
MRTLGILLAACALTAQAPQGHLRFAALGHRDVVLDLVDGGHPAFLAIPLQKGDAETLRIFVLAHTGPETMVLPDSGGSLMTAPAPPAWKVSAKRGKARLRTAYGEFWRYTPGLLLPTRFRLNGAEWALREAELPPKMLISNGE